MLKPLIRSLAFLANWVAWVARQPAMLLTMILGPFLILGLFALSNAARTIPADVIVVHRGPAEAQIPAQQLGEYFAVKAETADAEWARRQLQEREVDAVVLLPPDPREALARGEQAVITVETNEIDPIALSFLRADLRAQMADLNSEMQRGGVEQTKAEAADVERRLASSQTRLERIDRNADDHQLVRQDVRELDAELSPALNRVPLLTAAARTAALLLPSEEAQPLVAEVSAAERTALAARATLATLRAEAESPQPSPARIRQLAGRLSQQNAQLQTQLGAVQRVPTSALVQPFAGEVKEVSAYQPTLITYYAPAALALLLQHFAVTLAALSMVRARLLGMVEFWQIAPIRAGEIMAGNYLSYALLSLLAWAGLTAAVVYALGVPILGSPSYLVGAAALLILASLGIGFIISLLASNEQQAAQLAMLMLLGSVFLSGFVRPLESIEFPVRYVSYLLPATFGIQMFQDVMLRGLAAELWQLLALGALSLLGLIAALFLFRRELRPA